MAIGMSCGRASESCVSPVDTAVTEGEPAVYDLEMIRMLTGKRYFTPEEQDFMIDQYEIFCRETAGMDRDAVERYLDEMGPDSTVVLFVVMDVASSRTLSAAQRDRIDSINEKYSPEF